MRCIRPFYFKKAKLILLGVNRCDFPGNGGGPVTNLLGRHHSETAWLARPYRRQKESDWSKNPRIVHGLQSERSARAANHRN